MTGLRPVGPGLAREGRRLIAARLCWPDGAVGECERLELEFPRMELWWFCGQRSENPAFDREPGFYAWISGDQPGQMWGDGTWHGRVEWYGATAEDLAASLPGELRKLSPRT